LAAMRGSCPARERKAGSVAVVRFLEARLRSPLPGPAAQLRMAPHPRAGDMTYPDVGGDCLQAGVLLLLFPRRGRLFFYLTKRTETVLHHRGQVSLPGGERHGSETPVQTALRETNEELGVSLAGVSVLGRLTPLYIPPSNFCIHPVVASVPRPPACRPHAEEVAELIEAPLLRLLDPSASRRECRKFRGRQFEIPYYDFDGCKVWGATAMVLAEFAALFDP